MTSAPATKLPHIPADLLVALEKAFPDVMPGTGCSLDELRIKQGEVGVVRFLRRQFDIQNKTIFQPGV